MTGKAWLKILRGIRSDPARCFFFFFFHIETFAHVKLVKRLSQHPFPMKSSEIRTYLSFKNIRSVETYSLTYS